MKLRCDLVIQNLNDQKHDKSISQESKAHKSAMIGLYRPKLEDIDNEKDCEEAKKTIILTIETKTLNLKYKLKRIETYTKFIKEGKATLKLIEENIFLLISNTPSLTLINFISFLNVKIQKSNLANNKENKANAASNTQVQSKKYVNKLLSNVQCTLGKNSLKVISPLCEQEVNDVLKRKLANQLNQSPISASSSQYKTQFTQKSAYNKQQTQTPSRSANRNKPIFKHSLSTQNLLVQLTDEQKQVLSEVKNGSNIFFTGSGGTGKSFLINVIRKCLPNDTCFVTASTGVAASLIGGITLHIFAGLTANDQFGEQAASNESQQDIQLKNQIDRILNSKEKLTNWKKCQHLIIDEISMIDANLFEQLDEIARVLKRNDEPFGGIQMILSGDFFQLPPVSKYGEKKKKFCFQSPLWNESIDVTIQLTKIKRQNENQFINMLEEIRFGRISKKSVELLEKSKEKRFKNQQILPTKLCTHKDDVEFINKKELDALGSSEKYTYKAIDTSDQYTRLLNYLCPAKEVIVLKMNAQVMLLKNLDLNNGLVNGARGFVCGFSENKMPIVKFMNGFELTVKYETWTFNLNSSGTQAQRKQLPLQLSWAISVHKAQGMTLDCAEMSLSRVFEYGQAYVALSRVKSLDNLKIIDFDVEAIKANEVVVKFYESLSKNSAKSNRLEFD